MFRFKIIFTLTFLFSLFILTNCSKEKKDDSNTLLLLATANQSSQEDQEKSDLTLPALDTATLVLDGVTETLTNAAICDPGTGTNGNVIIEKANLTLPILNLHKLDMTKHSGIFIENASAPSNGAHVDLDYIDGNSYSAKSDCQAKVMENTTIYDLQVLDCPITTKTPSSVTKLMSFRIRCTKH